MLVLLLFLVGDVAAQSDGAAQECLTGEVTITPDSQDPIEVVGDPGSYGNVEVIKTVTITYEGEPNCYISCLVTPNNVLLGVGASINEVDPNTSQLSITLSVDFSVSDVT